MSIVIYLKKNIRQKAQKEAAKRAGGGSQLGARAAGLQVRDIQGGNKASDQVNSYNTLD